MLLCCFNPSSKPVSALPYLPLCHLRAKKESFWVTFTAGALYSASHLSKKQTTILLASMSHFALCSDLWKLQHTLLRDIILKKIGRAECYNGWDVRKANSPERRDVWICFVYPFRQLQLILEVLHGVWKVEQTDKSRQIKADLPLYFLLLWIYFYSKRQSQFWQIDGVIGAVLGQTEG